MHVCESEQLIDSELMTQCASSSCQKIQCPGETTRVHEPTTSLCEEGTIHIIIHMMQTYELTGNK